MAGYNPIRTVGGVAVKAPSVYKWKLQDISANDAGRTEDGKMSKMRIGQVVGIDLAWNNVDTETASTILTAFNPEYITVCYLDAKAGDYLTGEFYVGDRSAPLYNAETGLWSNITFSIICRNAVPVDGDEYPESGGTS